MGVNGLGLGVVISADDGEPNGKTMEYDEGPGCILKP